MRNGGVSPILSTILLIGVTIGLTATVTSILWNVSDEPPAPFAVLNVSLEVEDNDHLFVSMEHESGDALVLSELKIVVKEGGASWENSGLKGTLSVGGRKKVAVNSDDGSLSSFDNPKIQVIHVPSKKIIFEDRITDASE